MRNRSSILLRKPSKRQAEILKFVADFQNKHDYSPSLGEIAEHFQISIPTVHQHISYLKQKKLLAAHKGKRRTIQAFNNYKSDVVEIPLMGFIAAGGPIEAVSNPEPFEVPKSMLKAGAKHYALRVTGTSMIEEGISDGDIVIIRDQLNVEDGEKAVAYLPDKDAVTLKKLYRENGRIKLVPANHFMRPFYEDNVEVQGKVVGVIRSEV